jgi:hypothetical protein
MSRKLTYLSLIAIFLCSFSQPASCTTGDDAKPLYTDPGTADFALPPLIPYPKKYLPAAGKYTGPAPASFNTLEGLSERTVRLALKNVFKLADKPSKEPPEKGLALIVSGPDIENKSPEAYRLTVEADRITIKGWTADAVLMGLRTLAQMALAGDINRCEIIDWPDMDLRATHICYALIREDLAYVCPNFEHLLELIDRLASLKYNAVVLELEAMFPYAKHPTVSCKIAFTPDQMKIFRRRLINHHIEPIPLIQSLGHVYYVLTHDQYASYRETPDRIQQYCATNPAVADLYMDFVEEWVEMFPEIKQIHIGGDESRQLGDCPRCRAKVESLGKSRLYLDHMLPIVERLHNRGLTPMLWNDIFEKYPEDIDKMPKYVKFVYWDYFPGHRPYVLNDLVRKKFEVIGACGVRFSAFGTELSVFYPAALKGIESLIPRAYREGVRGNIVTNWMKGSPYENTDFGFTYAAALAWDADISISREDFKARYAKITFGSDDPAVCDIFEKLSLWLPYAEPVQNHMPDRLDRFNLSGLRFREKWQKYTSPDTEPQTLAYLTSARARAAGARKILKQSAPKCTRGRRQLELFDMSAECIAAKADFALMLHKGRLLEHGGDIPAIQKWLTDRSRISVAWQKAKQKHHAVMLKTSFTPAIEFLNDLMFEPAEYTFAQQMAGRLAAKLPEFEKQ